MAREIELKLEVDVASLHALKAHPLLAPGARGKRQISVYFDTDDHRLHKTGLSLRLRRIGKQCIQTMKAETAAGGSLFDRPEWEHAIEGDRPDLTALAQPLKALRLAGLDTARLKPVFRVEVVRSHWPLFVGDTAIELTLDEGRIVADGAVSAICEIELELKQGSIAALFDAARVLGRAAPLRLGVQSKPERGYRLLGGAHGKAVKAEPVRLTADMTAAEGFKTIALACIRHFRLNEPLVVAHRDPEALHQARVAIRRLRSALSLFKAIAADAAFDMIRHKLQTIAGWLGEARNLDVLLDRIEDAAWRDRIETARTQAYDRAIDRLGAPSFCGFMLDLARWIEMGAWQSSATLCKQRGQSIEAFADDMLDRLRRRLKKRGANLTKLDAKARHRVRIEAKKLRYATEFFASLYDETEARRRRKAFLEALEAMQSSLGALNDMATGDTIMADLALPSAADAWRSAHDHKALLTAGAQAYDALFDVKAFWR